MYSVQISRRAMRDISKLPPQYTRLVSRHIQGLRENPRPRDSKSLRGRTDYRLRAGVYRILYGINDEERIVSVDRVLHRKRAYR